MKSKIKKGRPHKCGFKPTILAVVLIFIAATSILASCSSVTEEHIKAGPDAITFDRVVGRKAASAGFSLNKDSLVVKPL